MEPGRLKCVDVDNATAADPTKHDAPPKLADGPQLDPGYAHNLPFLP
jgi:hypothetical protein